MVDQPENPYRTDLPGAGPFYGRAIELGRLIPSLRAGRKAIAAVMGGRGMGKTSLALRIKDALEADRATAVHLVRRPSREPIDFFSQLSVLLGLPLDASLPVESIVEAVKALDHRRVVLLLDEIEGLIASESGRSLLDNLRIAYEALSGKLGIVIFGGSALRTLLASDTSPFLRTAEWVPLRGMSLDEATALIREPLSLLVPDQLVEVLWEQTGGHPLLLHAILEHAATLGRPIEDHLHAAMAEVNEERFGTMLFPIWWDNLGTRGQEIYRVLISSRRPLERHEFVRAFGNGPDAWIEVLETTGVARKDGGQLLPRGTLFRAWFEQNPLTHDDGERHRTTQVTTNKVPLASFSAHGFETIVVDGITRWARSVVEFPVFALSSKKTATSGNARLLPEQHFQLALLIALQQLELIVEPEPLSSARGRADLKIRWPRDRSRRACVEVKIWDHTGYKDVVEQVLGYAVPEDDFACVVMVDRQARPLREAYREQCLRGDKLGTIIWPVDEPKASRMTYPALVTRHERPSSKAIRVYHFLVQLPPDGLAATHDQ